MAHTETAATHTSWMLPNRVLVRFRTDVSPEMQQEMLRAAGARVREDLIGGEVLIEFEPTAAGSAAARRLARSAQVECCRRMMVIAVGYETEAEEAVVTRPWEQAALESVR
jgi:hypothetical protein